MSYNALKICTNICEPQKIKFPSTMNNLRDYQTIYRYLQNIYHHQHKSMKMQNDDNEVKTLWMGRLIGTTQGRGFRCYSDHEVSDVIVILVIDCLAFAKTVVAAIAETDEQEERLGKEQQ